MSILAQRLSKLLAALLVGLLYAGCAPPQKQSTAPELGGSEAISPPIPSEAGPIASPELQSATVEELWGHGSRFSVDLEVLRSWQDPNHVEVFGTVEEIKVANAPQFFNYTLRQFLVRVERVAGSPYGGKFIPPAAASSSRRQPRMAVGSSAWRTLEARQAGTVVDGPIVPGDLVWISVRLITGDRPVAEELVSKGTKLWAVYEAFPEEALDPFISPKVTPLAWTAGLSAYSLMPGTGG